MKIAILLLTLLTVSCEEIDRSKNTVKYINEQLSIGKHWNPIFTNFILVEANEEFSVYSPAYRYNGKNYYITVKNGKIVSIWTKNQYQ